THVEVRNVAVGEKAGKLIFAFPSKDPGRGTADELIREQIMKEPGSRSITIDAKAIDSLILSNDLPKPDFAKIDVEGMELNVLQGMHQTLQKHRPKLFIEIHGATMQAKVANIRQVASYLLRLDYKIYHVETDHEITRTNMEEACEGHLYCI